MLCNKGDVEHPKIRARWVATEVNTGNDVTFYAATPPLEAKRLLFSKYAHLRRIKGPKLQISLCDITKAYFNAKPSRDLFVRLPREMGLPSNHVGHLLRCCYGTRDAGSLWEDAYTQALLAMGFQQGRSSPCVSHHKLRDITIVVHGDDFTALGLEDDLTWYEKRLAEHFEIGDRHRISDQPGTEQEARILNRIIRVDENQISYEADPRHIELLARSLNLTTCRFTGATGFKHKPQGQKEEEEEEEPTETPPQEDEPYLDDGPASASSISSMLRSRTPRIKTKKIDGNTIHIRQTVTFNMDNNETHIIDVPYRHVYGYHPSTVFFTGQIGGPSFQLGQPGANPYTGKFHTEQQHRLPNYQRERLLAHVLAEGAAWESSNADCHKAFVASITKKKFKKKRLGRKSVISHEKLEALGDVLTDEQQTTFRALAARANYLALDRPDCAFAAKELCRECARPTSESFNRLRHLVRYLVHAPRLIYNYQFEDPPEEARVHVDTDFAGCAITRRSTSGGTITWGSHLIKHWSATQTVIALSSGEAELSGITKGAAHGLGFQSLAKDMNIDLKLHVLSDAVAAIGICKRRGLGRIRHLHVADLWIQERLKSGDFLLSKVAGASNPADLLTKYVDKQAIIRLLPLLGMTNEEGRARLAPQLTQ